MSLQGLSGARMLALVGATAAFLALLSACRPDPPPDDLPVEMELSIAPTPPIVGPVRLVIVLTDPEGGRIDDAQIEVEGMMTHAGMAPVLEAARHEGDGRYVVEAFEFTMGGDWHLSTRIRLADGREALRQREVRVVGERPGDDPGGGES